MKGYLGETIVKIEDSEYKNHTKLDWVEYWVVSYGGFDGAHHKDWVLDQVMQVIYNVPIILKVAKWDNGQTENRISMGEPTKEYLKMVKECEDDGYEYNYGIAP